MNTDDVRKVLDGLDVAHAEIVHSCLCFDLINVTLPELVGRELVDGYWTLCEQFVKKRDASALPALNAACVKIFEAIDEEVKRGTVTEHFVVEAVDRMKKLAGKPVRTFDATLRNDMTEAWQKAGVDDSIEKAFGALAPIVEKIVDQVEEERLEEAAGNLLALFGCLADIRSEHGEWFEHMFCGGEMTDLEFLADAAVEVYCHLRQREDLSEDWKEEMDVHLLLMNQRTGFFGDWTSGNYADMLYDAEGQSQDYSELEKCGLWMDWEGYAQEDAL